MPKLYISDGTPIIKGADVNDAKRERATGMGFMFLPPTKKSFVSLFFLPAHAWKTPISAETNRLRAKTM